MPVIGDFHVGEGVAAEMAKHGDKPLDIERYINEFYSITPGEKYLYQYHSIANKVYVLGPKTDGEE